MSRVPTRLASLRLEVIREENLPGSFHDVPALFTKWGLANEPQECAWVVAYDSQLTLRNVVEIGRWSHVRVEVHLPTLLSAVLVAGCERFMLVHNHPNKSAKPSVGDKRLTVDVMAAANACGLYFEDHVIVTPGGSHYSFADHGLLRPVDYAVYATSGAASR